MSKSFRLARSLTAPACGFLAAMSQPLIAGSPALSGLVAQADNAESVFSAPAAMALLEGNHLTIQGLFVQSFSEFEIDENKTNIPGGSPDNSNDPIIIPSVYYVRQLNDRWNAGLSLTVPSGFGSDYGANWSGRYESVDFSLVYIALTPAVSYRFSDKLSLGGAVGINYTAENSEVKFPQPFQDGDGTLKSDLDGIGVNVTLSFLYEFTHRTRAGLSWTSDSKADLEGDIRLRNLDPVFGDIADRLDIRNIDTKVTNTLPQRLLAGMYHEFESGRYVTLDGMWMKFSDFRISDIKLNGNEVDITAPDIYDDIYAVTVGAGFPASERLLYKVGAVYVSPAVSDDDRTFSIRLDRMWGVGAGASYTLSSGSVIDFNANLFNVGEASVDTESVINGRVAGKNEDPWAVMIEFTYHL